MKIFPRANEDYKRCGFELDHDFLESVYHYLRDQEYWTFHRIEDVLLAAERVLSQMEREKARKR